MQYPRRYKFGYNGQFTLVLFERENSSPLFRNFRTILGYRLLFNGKRIFEGEDYKPSPLHCPFSTDSARGLIGFLSCQPGDTDEEYFKDYSSDQLEFVKSYGEEMSMWCIDDHPEPFIWNSTKGSKK